MKYRIKIDPMGKISVETSNTTGPRCLKLTEIVRNATGGTLESLTHKQEFFQPEGETTGEQFNSPDLEQST
jgi:Protein of unknown function (DUF2997)